MRSSYSSDDSHFFLTVKELEQKSARAALRSRMHEGCFVDRPAQPESFKKRLKRNIRNILEQSLFFKTPYVWNDRRPLPLAELRSPSRPVGHVHERRLDAASDGRVTAVLPV